MNRTNRSAAACLTAIFAIMWACPAFATTDNLTVNVTPNVNIYDAYFLYGGHNQITSLDPSYVYSATATPLGNLLGGGDSTIAFPVLEPAGDDPTTFVGTFIGLYDTGNGYVTLGFSSYVAGIYSATPTSFANALVTTYSESQIATALLTGDTTTLDAFYSNGRVQAIAGIPVGEPGGLINFSLSSAGGSFSVAATPEPGTVALLGLGLFGCACFRRTRRAGR